MRPLAQSFRELEVYQAAFRFQQRVFEVSKQWPGDERFALTDQIRRSSRSIGANISESWAKRRYPAHFLSKLTDADGELQETTHWLDTALACGYLAQNDSSVMTAAISSIGKMLGSMISQYESFCTVR
jgi:four helix bundle protein